MAAEERTVYVAQFPEETTEDLLEELFVQAGPVSKVILREVNNSSAKYALIEFEDEASVLFSIEIMNGVKLFGIPIVVKPRNGTRQEELYRQKRHEIEERQRSAPSTPRVENPRDTRHRHNCDERYRAPTHYTSPDQPHRHFVDHMNHHFRHSDPVPPRDRHHSHHRPDHRQLNPNQYRPAENPPRHSYHHQHQHQQHYTPNRHHQDYRRY